ncbi:serine/arginine repetitive matrix protein 1-like [Tribolium madens]|uniref:serine/arginine repetitive matrix protein 1-like n=1 Tax=Tribolium madens TaxID=41895 RepID=UPI001CF75145|nr:serine/arginine repetitive matrix protein 1-like [Tribolium madens]
MIVPDEVVVEALLKDARKFKSKWELHTNEPSRNKPNVKFLKRTLSNVVKTNQNRMRRPREAESVERELRPSTSKQRHEKSQLYQPSTSSKRSPRQVSPPRKRPKKSKSCSKSKYRSPERKSRSKSEKKSSRSSSKSRRTPKR